MKEASELQAIVRALAVVWRARPLASDSAEGIGRWWFDMEDKVTLNELEKALDWMVRQGLITEVQAADGRCRYCRTAGDDQFDALLAGSRSG